MNSPDHGFERRAEEGPPPAEQEREPDGGLFPPEEEPAPDHAEACAPSPEPAPPPPDPAPEDPDMGDFFDSFKPEERGDRIGPYRLLQELGEGGFGSVWMAEQDLPVRRRVALKILKMGMDTKEVVARFEQERQALAMMDHPNIAKIFDAGATKWGRPYFAMELVRGDVLTKYCDEADLCLRERLELFIEVCQAVHHAHQKGIIHRDLKPSNILVSMNGPVAVPKVIDFGVAKATQGRLTDKTLFTQFEQVIGTPLYMSPEQAEMTSLDIDTRSDIYSLGVVLYEILTGHTPIAVETLEASPLEEIRRIIRTIDPPRPSIRVKTLSAEELKETAKHRHTVATKLSALIRGDLDWIVMKSIEKDRRRRYDSAAALALDLQRYLGNQTITARPPTVGYQLGKLVRRHRFAVGATLAVTGALVAGAIVSTWQAIAKEKALKQARAAESDTEAFGDFLVRRVLAATRPKDVEGGLGYDVTVAAALEEAVRTLEKDFVGRPRAEARARHAIGVTWDTLGRYQEAIEQLRRAIDLRMAPEVLGPDEPATLETINDLAVVYVRLGDFAKALPLYEMVLEKRLAKFGPGHPHVLTSMNNLAGAYEGAGDFQKALPLFEKAMQTSSTTLGPNDPYTLKAMGNLARVCMTLGDTRRAMQLYEDALSKSQTYLGQDHPDTLTSINNLAVACEKTGNMTRAMDLYKKALEQSGRKLGDDHPETLTSMCNLAGACVRAGALSDALPLYEKALEKGRHKPGADHRDTLLTMVNLAVAYEKSGSLAKALDLYAEALERRERTIDRDDPDTLKLKSNLAIAYVEAGQPAKSLPLFRETWERRKATLGADSPDTLKSLKNLALGHWMLKDYPTSIAFLEQHLATQKKRLPAGDPLLGDLQRELETKRREAAQPASTDQAPSKPPAEK